jgi:hypothetical protein
MPFISVCSCWQTASSLPSTSARPVSTCAIARHQLNVARAGVALVLLDLVEIAIGELVTSGELVDSG